MFDLTKNEEEVLKYWNDNAIMDKVRAKNKGKKPFYFLDGPPFVSGDLHPGQMWVKSMKDVLLRYRRFRGYDVYDSAGYDVHGLPIEKRAEAQLGVKNKQEIETKIGVENFIKACKDYVEAYIGRMDNDYKRFAISLDFSNPYIPSRTPYMEIEWSYLKKIHEKGLLYEDTKATTYCTSCGTSVSQGSMEVEYSNDTDPSIFVAFKVDEKHSNTKVELGENINLLIWTTTPWTLPANMSVAVNPKEQYVIAKIGNRRFILMKSRLDHIASLLNESAVIEKEFYGSELEGIHYISPLEEMIPKQREFRKYHKAIMSDELVSSGEGSGIVHIAPGHGLEDYVLGKRNKLPIFSPVNGQGLYTEDAGEYKGLKVIEEANKKVLDDINILGVLVHRGSITHSYPHCWRCSSKLVFIATDQWFVNIQKVKSKIINENRKVSWHPAAAMKWQEDVLQSSPDWAISRQRYWGTPLPIWKCQNGHMKVIGSLSELKAHAKDPKYVESMIDIHRPYIDNVTLTCSQCQGEMKRVKDVLDVWFDSATAYRASLTEEKFNELFPVDFILEGVDQLRGWFAVQLKMGTIVNGRRPFNNVVIDGMMLGEDRKEMHKKLGNFISLQDMLKITTADAFRLWCTAHPPELDLVFSKDALLEANRVVILLYNMQNLTTEYANAIGYKPDKVKKPGGISTLSPEDAWVLSRLNSTIKVATESLENYQVYKAVAAIKSFLMIDFSRFYLKMAKKSILDSGKSDAKRTINLINYVLYNSLILIAPITPLVAEKIYLDHFHFQESIFLEKWPKYDNQFLNADLEKQFDVSLDAVTAILNSREKANVKLRWPLAKATVEVNSDVAYDSVQRLSHIIEDFANVKKIDLARTSKANVEIKPLFQKIGPDFKENAGAVAEALKSVNGAELIESIGQKGEYQLHTSKGPFMITKEHFASVEKIEKENAIPFKYGVAYVDKEISKELREEALVREFERGVQMLRKDMKLRKGDKIHLKYKANVEIADIVERNSKQIKEDIGAVEMLKADAIDDSYSVKDYDIEDDRVSIGIKG